MRDRRHNEGVGSVGIARRERSFDDDCGEVVVHSDHDRHFWVLLDFLLPVFSALLSVHSGVALRDDESRLLNAEFLHAERSPNVFLSLCFSFTGTTKRKTSRCAFEHRR